MTYSDLQILVEGPLGLEGAGEVPPKVYRLALAGQNAELDDFIAGRPDLQNETVYSAAALSKHLTRTLTESQKT
jgi:hypothetical protein